jgi:hypothetical protein
VGGGGRCAWGGSVERGRVATHNGACRLVKVRLRWARQPAGTGSQQAVVLVEQLCSTRPKGGRQVCHHRGGAEPDLTAQNHVRCHLKFVCVNRGSSLCCARTGVQWSLCPQACPTTVWATNIVQLP